MADRGGSDIIDLVWLLPLFALGALLYSSVGHGGATVYLSILLLAGYALPQVRAPVLILNILVASIAFYAFRQAGHLRPRLLAPLLVTSVPAAFLGAYVPLPRRGEEILLGSALLLAGLRLLFIPKPPRPRFRPAGRAHVAVFLALGALLGFLAGATGIGGGVFLSPVLLFLGWATVKEAGAVASAFIALNSLSGLAARFLQEPADWAFVAPLAVAVLVGGTLGAFVGARRLPLVGMQRLLGLVLLLAALRTLL